MLLEAQKLIFDIFRKDKSEEVKQPFYADEYGEWLVVSHNKPLVYISNILQKSIKKAGLKNHDLYVIQYTEDEKIRNLVSLKGMICSNGNVKELDLANAIKNSLSDNLTVGEMKIFKLKICGILFIFFYIDVIVRNLKETRGSVKLLFPPMGVNLYEIPYTLQSLIKNVIEKTLGISCSVSEIDTGDGTRLKAIAECRIQQTLESIESLRKALEYFSLSEPKISLNRTSVKQIELQIFINQLKTKTLIPLIWDRFIIDSLRC
ncbi:hypothetical protein [Saccharolobus islandicus]|uniref:Uncharacterized protein n=1 Tax=Saccharolobus islandicus (strain REY15A) TaxID=930945 RepID=F0NBI3_SACI5|nr:hypothetical protein [Sulfolobus islandicus]ADX85520.1 conserved hypothetical protein [Sulfolobus islandicus REY15A]